ncbi:putative thiazole-containing bacteriocin maturation protein [Cohnella pontilimi]|uniref:Putative thiazole-containing bacteriocin maturation protein n=1 Tax=Cohnella pontilimi TaxID=2564100 RepID=A0A4U0FGE9_9BACL|nr:putative thiazole-containing bacteriocin maturation protein [Cohnella pontilimi]TJY43940.1 putative thiazole-containing bacteriocin maturation protein [Cohnella pontilimi]
MNPAARLKVKGDTAYLPDGEGGVYFRNNSGSFRMTGSMMDRWIEKLFPVWNGVHTMEELTDGLPEPHRNRLYEISNTLIQNGFVRDVSEDLPHRLPDDVQRRFAAQIEFLDNLEGSGGYRFQGYRQAKVLAVGSGTFGLSLASALLDSGLTRFHLMLLDAEPEHRERLSELSAYSRQWDEQSLVEELAPPTQQDADWREIVAPFDWIVYGAEEENLDRFRALHRACREERKVLLPAMFIGHAGIAGPLVSPDSPGCWESAWRRLHRSVLERDPELNPVSSTAQAMLANVLAFELFKSVSGTGGLELQNQLFLLNLETLESRRHPFAPHPLVTGDAQMIGPIDLEKTRESDESPAVSKELLPWFEELTSPETGLFQLWDEGDLRQLPLSVCRIAAVDPLSHGPAGLLPEGLCGGFTHEEARTEAGLAGIEAYSARLHSVSSNIGVGTGTTLEDAVGRGLLQRLTGELRTQLSARRPVLFPVTLTEVQDERVRYYFTSLKIMRKEPVIAAGEDILGFPVMWAGTGDGWYGSVAFDRTSALRSALLAALLKEQLEDSHGLTVRAVEASSVLLADNGRPELAIPAGTDAFTIADLHAARHMLQQHGKRLAVYELRMEPFLKEGLAGVFGVTLEEEESA